MEPELKVFKPKGVGLQKYTLKVFNRWGELIWQSSELDEIGGPAQGWDGTMKGAPAPQGVYIWEISGLFMDGTEWKGMSYSGTNGRKNKSGTVTLIR